MPAALSHFLFAQDCLSRRPALFPGGAAAVLAGTQGPDPLAFYGRLPWRRRGAVDSAWAAGETLHAGNPETTYTRMLRFADARPEPQRGRMRAFVLGLVLHYVLDRKLHPYVYFHSGFDERGLLSGDHLRAHNRFEAALAAGLWAWLRPGSPIPPPRLYLNVDPAVIADADILFSASSPGLVDPHVYRASWSDMVLVLRILHDPRGFKKRLISGLAGSLIIPAASSPEACGGCLNKAGTPWRNPGDGAPSSAMPMELYAEALDEGLAALDALARGTTAGVFDGRNHEGLPPGERMIYKREP